MPIGNVKLWKDDRGFGFVESKEIEGDVFVHYSAIVGQGRKTLKPGQKVTFDLDPNGGKDGKHRAANVVPIEG